MSTGWTKWQRGTSLLIPTQSPTAACRDLTGRQIPSLISSSLLSLKSLPDVSIPLQGAKEIKPDLSTGELI